MSGTAALVGIWRRAGDARTYDIVRGGQAFYHKILTDLREWNVSADICQNLEETAKEE